MRIGIPRELKDNEFRVSMTPAGVRELVSAGHTVVVERWAGTGSSITDAEFVRAGASILDSADEVWGSADLVCKVKEPIAEEFHRLREDLVLFTYLHLAASRECTEALRRAGAVGIAYETVQARDGSLPLLAPMSEVAGRMAPLVGAEHLQRPGGGRGVLMSGVPGVRPARVVVIGAGVSGVNAAMIAVGMHAEVQVLDRDLAKLRAVDAVYRGRLGTLASSEHAIEEACLDADLVIGAVLVPGAKAPRLVSDDLVARMRPGSVLVDIAVDQGGCFESTHPTTHSEPTFMVHDSVFYCVANMPGAVPHTSTHALTNATLPYTAEIAAHGWRDAARLDPALALGVNIVAGAITNAPVAEAHGFDAVDLDEVLG
ncbi:MAG TPA: alanine dehydrogenase [Acidimicrobiales bacterium]|nr:alanine dehydrogenase [Acidimicrobiales bacterium]